MKIKIFFLLFFVLSLSACSFSLKKEKNNNNSNLNEKVTCDILCLSASNNCLDLNYDTCLKLCPIWNDYQIDCVEKSSTCDDLYSTCVIDSDFVFQPNLETPCSMACNSYATKCDIQSNKSKELSNQNVYDECLLQCSSWTDKQINCIKDAESCYDIISSCS